MSNKIQSVRGMSDFKGLEARAYNDIVNCIANILQQFNFEACSTPIVEKTALFVRSVGEVTDIVEKEMYTFNDRNGDSLSLRPECTASCARALIENSWLQTANPLKIFYHGAMFRHERPQKGRYRQFHQFGAEIFGSTSPYHDAELVVATHRLWRSLKIDSSLHLEINTLGSNEDRQNYKKALVAYLKGCYNLLDEDSQKRMVTNPLRILDSKAEKTQDCLRDAPKMNDFISEKSREAFNIFTKALDVCGVEWQLNQRLVRGLDYYNDTVFEWVSDALGSQGTICGGGRYDGLVELLGGKSTPGVGFAMGIERIMLLYLDTEPYKSEKNNRIFVISQDNTAVSAFSLSERLRKNTNWQVYGAFDGSSMKSQFKKADKSGAQIALILGEDELNANAVTLKNMQTDTPQQLINIDELENFLETFL